ncbi:MAG TPA: hypothetical protein VMU22_12640 [Rhizomicrobium sp.]|nr:hypothetical protein [Rhizomicrobium sp.]
MNRLFGSLLALLIALPLMHAPAHASTVSVTYNYVYFGTIGKHQRQPRTVVNGGFTTIASQSGGQQSTGLTFQPGQLPATEMVGNQTYDFSFVTITGGSATAGGPPVGVSSTNPGAPPSVVVGTSNIVVLAVYVPVGGPPCPGCTGSGATIDAFDETTGSLFNDTFVKVAPDANNTLTTSGNVYGYVDTTNSAETISSLTPTSPTGVNFSRWVKLLPSAATTNGSALGVGKGVNTIALAFYDAPPPGSSQPTPKQVCQQELASLNKITVDRGPLLTVSQYAGVKATLQKCVQQGYLTQSAVTAAENGYQNMLNTHNNPPPPMHP